MGRILAILVVALVAVAAVLYQVGGVRVALDGSGTWPRYIFRVTDFDALEADRARQRPQPGAAAAADIPLTREAAPDGATPSTPAPAAALSTPLTPTNDEPPAAAGSTEGSWTDFRGPARDGRTDERIRTSWPAGGLPLLWKQPIGLGYASFVAADGRAFTIEQRRRQEVVSAYDVETGHELWTHGWDGEFTEGMGGDGPRATPTYHAGRLYALGALGELRCLDAATGKMVWRRNILEENGAPNLQWGMSASPLIVDQLVIVLPGGSNGRSVAAYRADSGEPAWSALDDGQAYVSPMLVTLAGVRQVLMISATRAVAFTPGEGRVLWEFPWNTSMGINAAQPLLLGGDRVFLSASYGKGAAVIQISRTGDRLSAAAVWENHRMKNKFTSSVLHGGRIYGLDESILACVDAATGEQIWKGGRYGYGQILLAGDHLIVLTESGQVALVAADPTGHRELARFDAIDGKTWNHPIVVNGRLLVRNLRQMAAFDIRPM